MDKEDIENEIRKAEAKGIGEEAEKKVREIEKEIDKLNKLDELSKKKAKDLTDADKKWLKEQGLWDKFLKSGNWEDFINLEKDLAKARKEELVEELGKESDFVKKTKTKIKEFIESKVKEDYRKKLLLEELNSLHTEEQIGKFITYLHDEIDESVADIWVRKEVEELGKEKSKKPRRWPRISWHEEPSELWKPIAALVGIVFGGFLTATGNWIFGLPLLAAGLIILFTTEDLGEKLVNLFAYLKNHPKVSIPLGVILSSVVLFFIFGFWAAIVPPIAAGLFYAISKKRGGKGAEFFLEFIVSVIGIILFVGGVHYASVYLFISFDWRQLVAFGIGNSILLWLLWFMGRGGKGELEELEKEKLEAEKKAAEAQKKAAEAAIAKKYTPSGGVYEANKIDREKQNDEKE